MSVCSVCWGVFVLCAVRGRPASVVRGVFSPYGKWMPRPRVPSCPKVNANWTALVWCPLCVSACLSLAVPCRCPVVCLVC